MHRLRNFSTESLTAFGLDSLGHVAWELSRRWVTGEIYENNRVPGKHEHGELMLLAFVPQADCASTPAVDEPLFYAPAA